MSIGEDDVKVPGCKGPCDEDDKDEDDMKVLGCTGPLSTRHLLFCLEVAVEPQPMSPAFILS